MTLVRRWSTRFCLILFFQFSSVQSLSHVQLFATPWIAAHQASLSITNSQRSPKLTSIQSVMPSSHLILCRPLLLLPPIPPSIRVFSNKSTLRMRWPKYCSFSFSISLSKEHPGLISFRMDLLDLLAVQGTLKSLLQHHSSKASILQGSDFFTVQLSYPYSTTGKTIALARWTFVGKVISLLLNMLSRLVITFLPRSKCLNFMAAVTICSDFGGNDAKAETPVLWPPHVKSWLVGKDSDAGRGWGQEEKGTTVDEMAGWHCWLNERESQWTLGVGDGQGGLVCCDSWGRKESDTTEQLIWSEAFLNLAALSSALETGLEKQPWNLWRKGLQSERFVLPTVLVWR